SSWQFLSLFGICMAIPVLLSFFPIQSAVRKSVRHAQQWVFTTSHKSLRWISKWFPAARHVYVGNNLLHNLFLFLLSLMLVVTGLSITLSGFNLTQSLNKEMDSLEKTRLFDYAIDVYQTDSLSISGPGFPTEIDQLQYVWVEAVGVQNPILNIPEKLFCARITPNINIPSSRMIKGEWDPACTNCLYVTQRLSKDFRNTNPGDSIQVWDHKGESTWLLFGGVIKLPEGSSSALRPTKQISRWNQLFLFSDEEKDLRADLKAFFSQQTGEIPHISSAALSRQIITDHLEGNFFVITGLGLTALAISLVGIVILINLNLIRREKDIGILKALGARNQQVSHLFEQEVLMVLGVAVGIGVPLSIMLSQSMCFYFGDMVLDFPLVLDVSWVFAGLTSLVFMMLTAASIRYQVRKRVSRKVRYLLQG
ncbi:MAG: ABC transporter permease, partial [Bacteroidota bacterium]